MEIYCIFCGENVPLNDQTESNGKDSIKCENCKKDLKIGIENGEIQVFNEEVEALMNKLRLELVKLSSRTFLVWALREKSLSYPKLAHAYLEISRVLYELLKNYSTELKKGCLEKFRNTKLKKLRIGFKDLLKLIQDIQEKKTIRGDPDDIQEGKNSVWNNKNNLFSSLEFYETIMQNLKTNKYTLIGVIAIGITIIVSIFGLFLPLK